eukprot:gene25806-32300_t
MYASLIPNVTFEKNGFCVTVDYSLNGTSDDGKMVKMNVFNAQRLDSPSGKVCSMNTTIVNYDFDTSPGKFYVAVGKEQKDVLPYWILSLGEVDTTQMGAKYPWMIISNPLRSMLFILARDAETFETQYKDDVMLVVARKGFIFPINKPMPTFQSKTECVYSPEPTAAASDTPIIV